MHALSRPRISWLVTISALLLFGCGQGPETFVQPPPRMSFMLSILTPWRMGLGMTIVGMVLVLVTGFRWEDEGTSQTVAGVPLLRFSQITSGSNP